MNNVRNIKRCKKNYKELEFDLKILEDKILKKSGFGKFESYESKCKYLKELERNKYDEYLSNLIEYVILGKYIVRLKKIEIVMKSELVDNCIKEICKYFKFLPEDYVRKYRMVKKCYMKGYRLGDKFRNIFLKTEFNKMGNKKKYVIK